MNNNDSSSRCISAKIVPSSDKSGWYEQAKAIMTFADESVKVIPFYDDEISFTADELIGLTREQADELYCEKQGKADH